MRRLLVIAMLLAPAAAAADHECRFVDVDLVPSDNLQIVAWAEDIAGNYVDTVFITDGTGRRGLGNRPGVMDMRSAPLWPHGPRLDVFPVWAHRHGFVFPAVVFQQGDGDPGTDPLDVDRNLSQPFSVCSTESYYCSPLHSSDPRWQTPSDAVSCATPIFTDKGKLSETRTTLYPPRSDLAREVEDHLAVEQFAELNQFDTVSQATPAADLPYRFGWEVPPSLAAGSYLLRVEVSKEADFNATFTSTTYPPPDAPWAEYGKPYRGQPAVTYEVPFEIGSSTIRTSTASYAGYADLDGNLHPPDATITTDTPGSGASRLRLAIDDDAGSMYRVRVTSYREEDLDPPAAPTAATVTELQPQSALLTFVEPGDDGTTGTVTGYEIRYQIGDTITDDSFAAATLYEGVVEPIEAGGLQTLSLTSLLAGTHYVVAIRAYDNCKHVGPLAIVRFVTPGDEVSTCGSCASSDSGGPLLVLLLAFGLRRRAAFRRARVPVVVE